MNRNRTPNPFIVAAILVILPTAAWAQSPSEPRKEGVGVALMFTGQAGAGKILSLRVSAPAGNKAAFDFDLGWAFSGRYKLRPPIPAEKRTGKPIQFRWLPGHVTTDAHVRWIPWERHDSGWSTAFVFGARFMQGTSYDADNKKIRRYWTKGFDLGLGFDRVLASGHRAGVEGGNSITFGKPPGDQLMLELSGPSIWGSVFGSWVVK